MQEKSSEYCVKRLKLLCDKNRYGLLKALAKGPHKVSALSAVLNIEPTLLSYHLRVLREGGLVAAQRLGKEIEYSLANNIKPSGKSGVLDLGCCQISFPS